MRPKMAKMRLTMPKMRAPHPRIPSASSTHLIDWRAKEGPRWVQVGSKSSQDCRSRNFENRHFAWEGCQKSRFQEKLGHQGDELEREDHLVRRKIRRTGVQDGKSNVQGTELRCFSHGICMFLDFRALGLKRRRRRRGPPKSDLTTVGRL